MMLCATGLQVRLLAVAFSLLLVFAGCTGEKQLAVTENQPLPDLTTGLPAISDLINHTDQVAHRATSSIYNQQKNGDQEYATAANSVEDNALDTQLLISGPTNPGWAIYHFTGLADEDFLGLLTVYLRDSFPDKFYIGFADFESMSWKWQTVQTPGLVNPSTPFSEGHYINHGGIVFVAVVVSNDTMNVSSVQLDGELNDMAPVARLTSTPYYNNQTVDAVLDASTTVDRDSGVIVQYEWDWEGDGIYDETGSASTTGHVYIGQGRYYPTVRVTDDDGLTDTHNARIEVQGWTHTFGDGYIQQFYDVGTHYTHGSIYAVGVSQYAGANSDVLICKYDRFGNPVWQRTWGGDYRDEATGVACDKAGNVFIAGQTGSPEGAPGVKHILLLKLNSRGDVVWEKTWRTTSGTAYAGDVALDAAGNVYVGATTYGIHPNNDMLVLKYDPNGTLVWEKLYATLPDDEARDIHVTSGGDVYITGMYIGGGIGEVNYAILKLTTDGAVDGMIAGGGPGWDEPHGISVDADGNVYLCGEYDDKVAGKRAMLLVKYDSNLDLDWARQWLVPTSSAATAVNLIGGFMTAVHAQVTGYVFDGGSPNDAHVQLLQFDSDGHLEFERTWAASADQRGLCATTLGGNLIIAGVGDMAGGGWVASSGTVSTPVGDFDQWWFGTLENVSGIQGSYTGNYVDLPGTFDTGGGGDDAFIMGWFPDKL